MGRSVLCLLCLFFSAPLMQSAAPPRQELALRGRVQLSSSADASSAVVWLTPLGDSGISQAKLNSRHARLLQKNKTFAPHILIVPVGSAVEFPNQDPFCHNVFSLC